MNSPTKTPVRSASAALALSLAFLIAGCSKSQPAARTDAQLAGDAQTRISSDPALANSQISIATQNGVVTLSGTVPNDGALSSALNDVQQVEGVRQVVSRLQSGNAAAAPAVAQTAPAPAEEAAPARRVSRPRSHARSNGYRSSRTEEPSAPPSYASNNNGSNSNGMISGANSTPTYASNAPAAPVVPPPPPVPQRVTVPAGTELQVRTSEPMSSERTQPDQMFHGVLSNDVVVEDGVAIPAGADVEGRVVDVHPSTHYSGQAMISLQLTKVSFNGKSYALATDAWTRKGNARGKNTVAKVGTGAAVGAVLGGIFGGGRGAAIGATAGAGAGAGANTITKGQPVELNSESLISFRLASPMSVYPSSSTQRRGTTLSPDGQNY